MRSTNEDPKVHGSGLEMARPEDNTDEMKQKEHVKWHSVRDRDRDGQMLGKKMKNTPKKYKIASSNREPESARRWIKKRSL